MSRYKLEEFVTVVRFYTEDAEYVKAQQRDSNAYATIWEATII